MLESRLFEEISVGDRASLTRTLSLRDAELCAVLMDANSAFLEDDPTHLSGSAGWASLVLTAAFQTGLPGPGSVLIHQDYALLRPVVVGDTIVCGVTVTEKRDEDRTLVFSCEIDTSNGEPVLRGSADVRPPGAKVTRCCAEPPDIRVNDHIRYQQLVARCQGLPATRTAIVHAVDPVSLTGAVEAARMGLIEPVFVGPEHKIRSAAAAAQVDISAYRLVDTPHSHAAAAQAVCLARSGEVEALMKGSLHTDELMHEVLLADSGLRTERRISHVYLFDVPSYPRPLLITDAAINIRPSLSDKRDICRNAIDLSHILGIAEPKIAILCAVETVSDAMPSTLDAAALCKMADRGQITGALLDGPLAFDNAISPEAARMKGIVSDVAGQADILLVPDLEAGNMLAKQLTFFVGADAAGIVLGARLPIILTSRADSQRTRIASCAIAALMADARRRAVT
jgi:phosphotransacetylase